MSVNYESHLDVLASDEFDGWDGTDDFYLVAALKNGTVLVYDKAEKCKLILTLPNTNAAKRLGHILINLVGDNT